jgi:mono/diheme cytochrome c family protein
LRPYVVKNFPLKEPRQRYRVGFLGVTSRESFLKTEDLGYTWADPVETVKKWVPELKKECDFVVVLACVPAKDAIQMAVDNGDINIILDGFKHQGASLPARINRSNVVFVEDEGRILGELRFNIGEKVEVQPLNHLLTRDVKDEPEMLAFVNQARAAITAAQHELANTPTTQPPAAQPATASSFVAANACGNCHQPAFQVWQNSRHAHAIEILKKEKKEFDTSCVTCHVTGAGKEGGFIDLNQTPHLANVQCESCHGSGRDHVANPNGAKMAKVNSQTCVGCHTRSNSPEFEFLSYWERVKH